MEKRVPSQYTDRQVIPGGKPWAQRGKHLRIHGILSEDGRRVTVRFQERVVDVRVTRNAVTVTSVFPDDTATLVIPLRGEVNHGE